MGFFFLLLLPLRLEEEEVLRFFPPLEEEDEVFRFWVLANCDHLYFIFAYNIAGYSIAHLFQKRQSVFDEKSPAWLCQAGLFIEFPAEKEKDRH